MLTALDDNTGYKASMADCVVLVVLKRVLNEREIQALEEDFNRAARRHPGGIAVLVMAPAFDTIPTTGVRHAAAALAQRLEKQVVAACVVIEVGGLKSTIWRTLVNTILMAARVRNTKIFADLGTAATWLANMLPAGQRSPQQLVEDARSMARSAPPPSVQTAATRAQELR